MQILTSAAMNQFAGVSAVFLRVLVASAIDSQLSETKCAETVGARTAETHKKHT